MNVCVCVCHYLLDQHHKKLLCCDGKRNWLDLFCFLLKNCCSKVLFFRDKTSNMEQGTGVYAGSHWKRCRTRKPVAFSISVLLKWRRYVHVTSSCTAYYVLGGIFMHYVRRVVLMQVHFSFLTSSC